MPISHHIGAGCTRGRRLGCTFINGSWDLRLSRTILTFALVLGLIAFPSGRAFGQVCLASIPADPEIGGVLEVLELPDRRVLVSTDSGLYLLQFGHFKKLFGRQNKSRRQPSFLMLDSLRFMEGPRLSANESSKKRLLITTHYGLFDLQGDRLTDLMAGFEAGEVHRVMELSDKRVLVGTDSGLFMLRDNKIVHFPESAGWEPAGAFFESSNNLVLVGAKDRIYMLQGDRLVQLAKNLPITKVKKIVELSGNRALVDAEGGLFLLRHNRLEYIPGSEKFEKISEIVELPNNRVLIRVSNSLFLLEGTQLVFLIGDEESGKPSDQSRSKPESRIFIQLLELTDNRVLVGAFIKVGDFGGEGGLFVFQDDQLKKLPAAVEPGGVYKITKLSDNRVLVCAANGLFIFQEDHLTKLPVAVEPRGVQRVLELSDGRVLVGAVDGVFMLHANSFEGLQDSPETGWNLEVTELSSGRILVGAESKLYTLQGDQLLPLTAAGEEINNIRKIAELSDFRVLVGADSGIFSLQGDQLVPLESKGSSGLFEILELSDGRVLVDVDMSLFLFIDNRFVTVPSDKEVGRIFEILELSDGRVLVRAESGLFFMQNLSLREAKTTFPEIGHLLTSSGVGYAFPVRLEHACAGAIEAFSPRLDVGQNAPVSGPQVIGEGLDSTILWFSVPAYEKAGTFEAQLQLKDLVADEYIDVGKPVEVHVDWGLVDYFKVWSQWIIAVYVVVYIFLLLAAPFSSKVFSVVTSKIWGRLGAFSWLIIRFSPFVQRQLFLGYFKNVRQQVACTTVDPYLPMSLRDEDGREYDSIESLSILRDQPRLWLQGNAGMGKTALIEQLRRTYFTAPNLSVAFQRFGFLPIFVSLRELANVQVPEDPQDWVIEVSRAALDGYGVRFEDFGLLRGLLNGGIFAIILDGLNETDREEEVRQTALRMPKLRLLVTSQETGTGFAILRLPRDVSEFTSQLLELWLGDEEGKAIFNQIGDSALLDEIRSGYDVRLVADLAAEHSDDQLVELPANRLGLYQAILGRVRAGDETPVKEDSLCRTAWDLWLAGERRLSEGGHLQSDEIERLRAGNLEVLRAVGGDVYEFRHDQMRAYLAARWAVHHSPPFPGILSWLEDKTIWKLGRSDQQEVWGFLAEIIGESEGFEAAQEIWKFSIKSPERGYLQHALQRVADQKGWAFSVDSPDGPAM